jgi:PAS domain S-box-containing protein
MRVSGLSTNFKLVIACAGCLALFLTIAAMSFVMSERLLDTANSVDEAHRMITQLEATVSHLTDAETAARQYAVTGQPSFRKDYDESLSRVRQTLEELRSLANDDPARRQSIHHLVLLVERRISLLHEVVFARQNGRADIVDGGSVAGGPTVMQSMREVASEMSDDYDRLIVRSKSSASATSSARQAILTATVAGVFFVIISTFLIRRDLALRAKSERALRAAERKIRDVFENAPIAIFESSPDGRFLTANATMAAMLGYDSPEDLLHHRNELKTPLYVGTNTREALVEKLNRDGVIQNYESQMYRKDGGAVWVTGNGRLVRDEDGATHFEAMLYDITERKHAQEQLANLKSQLEFVLDSATAVSIISTDLDGRIVLFNPGAEKMLGYSSVEVLDQDYGRFHYEPEISERRRQLGAHLGSSIRRFDVFVELARTGENDTREWTYVHKDGHQLAVLLRVTRVRNKQGDSIGFLMIGTDITYRKRSDQDRALLEQQLRRENLELERGARRALEGSRMKSEFLANMSHELRTPLNGIIGFAEMMHDEVIGPISVEHKEYLADILRSARHLLQLINDILDLSKVEAGRMEFQPEDVDLAVAIREAQAVLKSLSSKKHLHMETDLDSSIGEVHLDSVRLKQVLYNYLSNAIKFTPEGGRIVVRTRRESTDMFRIEVEDSGIGIDADDVPRLFLEFQQLDSGAGKRYQGTGLGLALTRKIAQAQGGSVAVKSNPGAGSTFSIVLPLVGKPVVVSELASSIETQPEVPGYGPPGAESAHGVIPVGD